MSQRGGRGGRGAGRGSDSPRGGFNVPNNQHTRRWSGQADQTLPVTPQQSSRSGPIVVTPLDSPKPSYIEILTRPKLTPAESNGKALSSASSAVNFQPPRVQRQQQQQQQQEQQQQRNGPSKNAQTQSQQQKQLQQQQPKRKKEPILLGDIIAASKSQSKATASHPPVGLNTKRVMPNSHRNHKREVVVHVSGQTVQRRGKEKEEVRPKRPTVLKQIILKDREEKFREVKTEAGENADEILDQRLESHRQKLLQKGVKLAIRTDNQRNMERLKNVPRLPTRPHQREYCRQILTEDLDEKVFQLISQLAVFQERQKQQNPLKAKMRRRLVVGLREATRAVRLGKAKCLILAPNLDEVKSPSSFYGLDDRISSLITVAREKRTPVVFALNRRRLGQSLNKIVKMSVVVISNADGGHDKLQAVLETSELVRQLSAIQYKQQQLHVRQLVGIKVVSLCLVDGRKETGGVLESLEQGAEINLAKYDNVRRLYLRAYTSPPKLSGSLVSRYNLPSSVLALIPHCRRVVDSPPYIAQLKGGSLESPEAGFYLPWRPVEGTFTISATAYSEYAGRGELAPSMPVKVTFIRKDVVSEIPEQAESDDEMDDIPDGEDGEHEDEQHDSLSSEDEEVAEEQGKDDENRTSKLPELALPPAKKPTPEVPLDEEALNQLRREKRKKPVILPPDAYDDEKPLPDYFTFAMDSLLSEKVLRSFVEKQNGNWVLFLKSPETLKVLILEDVDPRGTILDIKQRVEKALPDRPVKKARIYFYENELRNDVVLSSVPYLCTFSTFMLLRKTDDPKACLAQLL